MGEIEVKEKRICQYDRCKMEAEEGSPYCKYHVRMVESYEKMSPELRDVYERLKKERYG